MLYDIFIKIIKTVLIISFVTYNDSDYPVRANHSYINDMRDKAVKLLEDIEANKLPSLPHVLVIIGQDASLTTKVIKAANSPVYGRARHLNSLKHTLMFLGFDTIKSIAITASIKQFFSEYSNQKTQFLKNFWHHSLS